MYLIYCKLAGQLTAMSIDTKLDIDNCFCLPPSGHIVLSLDKVAYEQLGIEGQATHFSHMKPSLRYRQLTAMSIDTKLDIDNCFCLPPSGHIVLSLDKVAYEQLGIEGQATHFSHMKPSLRYNENTCPSSVAAYFAGLGYTVQQCEPKLEQRRDRDVLVPHLGECDSDQMLESETADSYVSTYFVPVEDRTREKCQLAYLQWTGFFTTKQIENLFAMLRKYVESRESLPWIAMHVQGFEDTPVCWNLEEHHFQQSGDNSYTVFLQPDLKFLLCQVLGPKRKPFAKSRQRKKKV
ncbi:hypothetical protein B566_EDAN007651 [Ephemera danica]|nr:hypothetical protein B566_EDAN007651 [Ephemera danica]